jgi:RHS repeat-associated protein
VDNFTLLGSHTISGFSLGTWYTLGLRANGSSISVEVNGSTMIGPVTDTAFTSGDAGVWSYAPGSAGSHRFDNFSATVLGGGVYRKVKVLAMTDARRRAAVTAPPANTTYRVYYYAGGQPIAMRVMPPNDATGTLYYLHSDHLGSTSVTTNASGGVLARQWYYPFGTVRGSVGTLPTKRTFTGQIADATGLMYFNARYYSQTLGRFVSADTLVPGAGNPQAFNRYAFVFNNPLKYVDPSGHEPCESGTGIDCQGGQRYSQTHEDELRQYLLLLLQHRELGEIDDLQLMQLFLTRSFDLHRDPLVALRAATMVVRRAVPNGFAGTNFGFGYTAEENPYFYRTDDSTPGLSDSGFEGFIDWEDHNQIDHFIGEAYISLYRLRDTGGLDDASWMVFGYETLGELRDGSTTYHAYTDRELGYVAVQFARNIYSGDSPQVALTTAVSTIRESNVRPPPIPAPVPSSSGGPTPR